jgi:hypothetical protein
MCAVQARWGARDFKSGEYMTKESHRNSKLNTAMSTTGNKRNNCIIRSSYCLSYIEIIRAELRRTAQLMMGQ